MAHRVRMNSAKGIGDMRGAEQVTFGGSGLDRAAEFRDDPGRMSQLWATGRVLVLWRGKALVGPEPAPFWVAPGHPVLSGARQSIFLGMDGGVPRFASDIADWSDAGGADLPPGFSDATVQTHPAVPPDAGFRELRSIMSMLTPRAAEMIVTAKAMLQWHISHGFCASCGAPSVSARAGWQRTCPACAAQHFPRTDPVVIMLVLRDNHVLLGRSPGWPEGMYSLLAGFVEPGETIEAAVRREVAEESGIVVGEVRYLASQPWPFPASLMLGCGAWAISETITIDPVELDDALWVSRETLLQIMAGQHPTIHPPRPGAIAQFLMTAWLADRLD